MGDISNHTKADRVGRTFESVGDAEQMVNSFGVLEIGLLALQKAADLDELVLDFRNKVRKDFFVNLGQDIDIRHTGDRRFDLSRPA